MMAEGRRDDTRGAELMTRHVGATPHLAARGREQLTPRQTYRGARFEASRATSRATATDEDRLTTATRREPQEMAEGRRDDARGAVLMARHAGATPQLTAHDREQQTPRQTDRPHFTKVSKGIKTMRTHPKTGGIAGQLAFLLKVTTQPKVRRPPKVSPPLLVRLSSTSTTLLSGASTSSSPPFFVACISYLTATKNPKQEDDSGLGR